MSDQQTTPRLPHYVRFRDLRTAGVVENWETLGRLIEDYGFPAGVLLSPNIRAWDVKDVQDWLAKRPTARKIVPVRRKREPIEAV
jgi:hypothetical protein